MTHPPSPGEPTKRRAHLSPSCDKPEKYILQRYVRRTLQARLAFDPNKPFATIIYNSPLGQSMVRVWGDWRRKGLINADAPDACENDEDCPSTLDFHSCVPEESCPEGTRGAPESKGECRDGACVLISEKTHVFDSANRPWLLPFIADKATGAERDLLLTLIRHASKARDDDRPSFAQMVDHLDRFENQKRGKRGN